MTKFKVDGPEIPFSFLLKKTKKHFCSRNFLFLLAFINKFSLVYCYARTTKNSQRYFVGKRGKLK